MNARFAGNRACQIHPPLAISLCDGAIRDSPDVGQGRESVGWIEDFGLGNDFGMTGHSSGNPLSNESIVSLRDLR